MISFSLSLLADRPELLYALLPSCSPVCRRLLKWDVIGPLGTRGIALGSRNFRTTGMAGFRQLRQDRDACLPRHIG